MFKNFSLKIISLFERDIAPILKFQTKVEENLQN